MRDCTKYMTERQMFAWIWYLSSKNVNDVNRQIRHHKECIQRGWDSTVNHQEEITRLDLQSIANSNMVEKAGRQLQTMPADEISTVPWSAGSIVFNEWGWEQTNISYGIVLHATEKSVVILPVENIRSEEKGFMTDDVTPSDTIKSSPFMVRKVSTNWQPWDGKARRASYYA